MCTKTLTCNQLSLLHVTYYFMLLMPPLSDLPMWPSGQRTRPLCAVERDAFSGRGSLLSPGASAYQELFLIISMH